jgi:hypothetical protein
MTIAAVEAEWNRDYIAFMRCDAGDEWLPAVESQLASWLREKQFDIDPSEDNDYSNEKARLSVRSLSTKHGRDLRLSMVEQRDDNTGTWATSFLAHDELGGSDWISLAVTNSQGRFVNVPRLARYLMQVLPLGDGHIEFADHAQVFRAQDIERLITTLADDERHGLVFVAGTNTEDDLPVGRFTQKVGDWTREVYGLSQVIVLDPAGTLEFEARVGERFRAPAWSIRTYQPGVRFSEADDARRHRILGTSRLGTQSEGRIRYLLGDVARNQAARRELPLAARRVSRRFDRVENQRLVEALAMQESSPGTLDAKVSSTTETSRKQHDEPARVPGVVGGQQDAAAQLELVQSILGIEEISEGGLRDLAAMLSLAQDRRRVVESLRQRVDTLQDRNESLEDANRELLRTLEDEQMERDCANLDVNDRDARIRWLESRLKEGGDHEALYLEVPTEFTKRYPSDFSELLEQIEALPGIEFTGDAGEVERLAAVDTNEAALRTAWDAVLTIADYIKARSSGDWERGLGQFIENTPDGYRRFPVGKFAVTETAATMKTFGDLRVFSVPTSVDESGKATMKTHFKLARIGMSSPRMHVLDGHPKAPIVYIGYIGPHLPNTMTN